MEERRWEKEARGRGRRRGGREREGKKTLNFM